MNKLVGLLKAVAQTRKKVSQANPICWWRKMQVTELLG